MSNEAEQHGLPKGWALATLGDICDVNMGQSPPSSTYNTQGSGLPFFQGKAEFGQLHPVPKVWCTDPSKCAEENDVLVSIRAPVGPTNLAPSRCCIGRGLAALHPLCDIQTRYVLYAVRFRASELDTLGTGTTFKAISGKVVRNFGMPVAPTSEQHRIVVKIEELFSQLDAGVAALERVKANLKRYRAAVLKAAVEGRLTARWRQEHPSAEPASKLLERILAERRRKWEEEQLRKFREAGRPPAKGWREKYDEPAPPVVGGPSRTPPRWCWASLSQAASFQNGRSFPSDQYSESGVKLLRPGNLFDDGSVRWNERNTRMMPASWAEEHPQFIIRGDELVMNLTAQSLKDEFLGRTCLTDPGEFCLLNQRLARITPVAGLDRRYALYLLKSWLFRVFVGGLNTGSLIQHMFTSQLTDFVFPLPPWDEQQQIVAEIDRRMSVIMAVEVEIEHGLRRATRLRQSILKRAFEGKLVPQDPSDEPAAKLLERIAAPQSATAKPSGVRVGTPRRSTKETKGRKR